MKHNLLREQFDTFLARTNPEELENLDFFLLVCGGRAGDEDVKTKASFFIRPGTNLTAAIMGIDGVVDDLVARNGFRLLSEHVQHQMNEQNAEAHTSNLINKLQEKSK